jgi:hypothetical protein
MTGSAFISHKNGWSCSNAVTFDVERDIEPDGKGGKVSIHTNTLKIKGLYNGKGQLERDDLVDCVFKLDDKKILQGFTGKVTGKTPTFMVIKLLTKTERVQEILKKIKEDN